MNKREKKLLALFQDLPEAQAEQLLDFAAFLHQRHADTSIDLSEPEPIERPETESVVAAVKRLSATYPMLNKDKLLNETASLVSQHVMQGRDAVEVIDELELVFLRHYEKLRETLEEQQENSPNV